MTAIPVDVSRLATYAASFTEAGLSPDGHEVLLVAVATLSAFGGAYLATRRLEKITIGTVRYAVSALMLIIGAALAMGVAGASALDPGANSRAGGDHADPGR